MAGAAATAATAFAGMVVSGFKAADAIGDAAERAGVAVDSLSRLKYVAEQNDLQFDSLVLAVKRWQVALSNAASGGKENAEIFKALQVNAQELKSLSLEDQLARIADQFRRIQDPADKTRVAVELFGRAGEQLVPLLNQGGDGIKQLTEEADRLGITLDEKTTRSVDKADKALKKLKATLDSFGSRVAGSIAEAIVGPVDNIDAAERRLDELIRRRDEILKGSVRLPGPERNRQLDLLNAQIKGAQEGLEIVKRMEQDVADTAKANPLTIPIDDKETKRLLEQLDMIRVSESLLSDPLIQWEKDTRTASEKVAREFEEFEVKLDQLVKAGKISGAEASKRSAEKLDDILQPIQISVSRIAVPLSAAQERAKAFADTLTEGLQNAARQGETSGKAILRSLLAAFESKALERAIEKIANSIGNILSKYSGSGGFVGTLADVFLGHAAGGGEMKGPRIVGEDGPELLLGDGMVMNRRQLAFAGGGRGATVNLGDTTIVVQGNADDRILQAMEIRLQQNNRKQLETFTRILKNNGYGDLR